MTRSKSLFSLSCFALMSIALGGCDHAGTYTCLRYFAEVGQACGPQLDCVDDASCVDGTCEPRGALGDACDVDAGLYCRAPYGCEAGVCAGRLSEGEDCDPDDVDPCAGELSCGREGSWHRCRPLVGAGEPCRGDGQCPSGQLCVAGACDAPPGLDEACTSSFGCAGGLSCVEADSRRVCRPFPTEEGDHCGPRDGCPAGLTCVSADTGDHLCIEDLPEGSACEPSRRVAFRRRCEDGTYCSHETASCERVGAEGEACSSVSEDDDESCGEGLACQTTTDRGPHRCLPPAGEGDSCREGQTCGANTYCDIDREAPELAFSLAP